MIHVDSHKISKKEKQTLHSFQNEILTMASFADKVVKARDKWDTKRNTKAGKTTFDSLKTKLRKMCPTEGICCYCEVSEADEIEHIFPKSLYPEKTFVWENYLWSCGICNGFKSNHFAIFDKNFSPYRDISPPNTKNYVPVQTPTGEIVFIDIRKENPMDYIELDFETFCFAPTDAIGTKDYIRAKYTIDTLHLNRDFLVRARRERFNSYCSMLNDYLQTKVPKDKKRKKSEIRAISHKTVWKEMQRQRIWDKELDFLFLQAPETLLW